MKTSKQYLKIFSIIFIMFMLLLTGCKKKTEYKVIFLVEDKKYEVIKTQGNEKITMPNNPSKEGYIFDGWYWDKDSWQRLFTEDSLVDKTILDDIVVHARFIDHNSLISTDFKLNNSTIINPVEGVFEDNIYQVVVKNKIKTYSFLENVEVINYAKWNVSFDYEQKQIIESKSVDLKEGNNFFYIKVVNERENKEHIYCVNIRRSPIYKVTFNSNGGTECTTQFVEEGTYIINPLTTKTGYTFVSWDYDFAKPIPCDLNSNFELTINAKWEATKYKITYDTNGGTIDNETQYVTYDKNETLLKPTRKGYTFIGWTKGEQKFNDGVWKYVEDITLQANWQINTYGITYDLNGGTLEYVNPKAYTVNDVFKLNNPTKVGYTFIGWTSVENQDPVSELTVSDEANDKHYIANFTPNKYRIIFDTNGGKEIFKSVSVMYDEEYDITSYIPTKTNSTFIGWYIENINISSGKWNYLNDITVKAKWLNINIEKEIYEENGVMYLNFGRYPQSVVDDLNIIENLNKIEETNSLGYIEYNGNEYKKVIANPASTYYTFDNGNQIINKNVYYFLVEPIKWRIIKEENDTYNLLSDMILDNIEFFTNKKENEEHRYFGGGQIFDNNYKYSNIRAWLNGYNGEQYGVDNYENKGFINLAFTKDEQKIIKDTFIDNSKETTGLISNQYVCENTTDKIYLLSYKDVTSIDYNKELRQAKTSDYTRVKDCLIVIRGTYAGNSSWCLRSPSNLYSFCIRAVNYDGDTELNHPTNGQNYGVRVSLTIIKG